MRRRITKTTWVWGSALVLGALLFVACGGSSSHTTAPPSTPTTVVVQDAKLRAADFTNINSMTRVGDHFLTNVRGHLAAALAVAHSAKGGHYPVGTVIQLVPQEAMVKRAPGFSPSTNDWEFFSLDVSAKGTRILSRGGGTEPVRWELRVVPQCGEVAVRPRVRQQPRLRAAAHRPRHRHVTADE